LIDQNGMDAIKLWSELFPKHTKEIKETWARIKPAWEVIRTFRDRAGFHADKPRAFFRARHEVTAHQQELMVTLDDFRKLFSIIPHAEQSELPDLAEAVDEFLDEMEAERNSKYDRPEFR
jgi:hypothetical protein